MCWLYLSLLTFLWIALGYNSFLQVLWRCLLLFMFCANGARSVGLCWFTALRAVAALLTGGGASPTSADFNFTLPELIQWRSPVRKRTL